MVKHADVTSIHLGSYVSASDPGAVGANKLWVDTSSGPPYQLKRRNAADDGWENVGAAATGMTNPMDGQGEMIYGGSAGSATALTAGSLAQHLVMRGSPVIPAWEDTYGAITLSLDGGGSAIATGGQNMVEPAGLGPQGRPICSIEAVRVTCALAWDEWWHRGTHRTSLYLRGCPVEWICESAHHWRDVGEPRAPRSSCLRTCSGRRRRALAIHYTLPLTCLPSCPSPTNHQVTGATSTTLGVPACGVARAPGTSFGSLRRFCCGGRSGMFRGKMSQSR